MHRKKYYHDSVPENERTYADVEAKHLAERVINKFEEEKALGKNFDDLAQGTILIQEKEDVNEFNRRIVDSQHRLSHQIQFLCYPERNLIMAEFINQEGDVADEIVSCPTPPEITNREEFLDEFKKFGFGNPEFDVLASHAKDAPDLPSPSDVESLLSSSTEDKSFQEKPPSKRKRDDEDDDEEQGPSKRVVTEDIAEETISSIYDLAGEE